MAMVYRRVLKWLLTGGTFVGVVGLASCTSMHRSSTTMPSDPVRTAVNPLDEADPFETSAPPQVNVFGELDGVARIPGKPVGDEGFQQHTFPDEGYDADVSVDPTGKWLVFASTRNSVHPGIYLQRVDGTAVTRLTADDADNAFPTFSPDGKQIAFCSTRSGVWNLYVMDVEGRNVVQVTSGNNQCVHPSFSPDGSQLVYSSLGSRSNQWELWIVDLGNGQKREIGYGLFPNWSPDRSVNRIVFQRARQRGSRWFGLWTLDLVNGEARRVTEVAVSSNAAIVSPAWSPDGKRLVFATIIDPTRRGAHRKGEQDIWTVNADGTDRRRLTDGNGINLSPVWATDNRVYFISDRGGIESVWSVRPEINNVFTASAPKTDNTNEAVGLTDPSEIGK